jgi:hypothetical protein
MSNVRTDSRDYDGHRSIHRPGVDKFSLVGPFMHPGAGLTGARRTTAMRILQDLGIDFGTAIGVEQPVAMAREER